VALIGAGPPRWRAAHELRRLGHAHDLREARRARRPQHHRRRAVQDAADRCAEEVDWVLGIGGIEVKTGVESGATSRSQSWRRPRRGVPGRGPRPDTRWASRAKTCPACTARSTGSSDEARPVDLRRARALVVGGGNTAIDAVRELAGLGVPR
jgi:dihydropyrimidine dehydrogenase (NAD+) subunit PreT